MRIDLMEILPVTLQRKEPFAIARGSSDIAEIIFVAVHSGRRTGHGCAAPSQVTRENIHSVTNALQFIARALSGVEFERPGSIVDRMDRATQGSPSAKAAVDMAIYDLLAQAAGLPLYVYLGGRLDRLPTDMTIGIMDKDAAVARAQHWVAMGFRALKIKVGRDWRSDVKRVKAVREAVGCPGMMGCNGEPQLSIAAALHLALATRNVRWLDLDSHFNLQSDPTTGLRFDGGMLLAPNRPGIGIDVTLPT